MFVAVASVPEAPSALPEAAGLCGLTVLEARTRCSGVLPRILVRQAAEPEALRLVAALEALGFRAFAGDPRQIPTDAQRIVARQIEWTESGFTASDRRGRHDCPAAGITLLQAGFRTSTQTELVKSTERKFSLGRALATGGIAFSKKVETVSEQTSSTREAFILVTRGPEQPAIILYEFRLDYQCLGADLKHARHLNFKAVLERLRALAPVPVDDRTAQPPYLRGLPHLGVDEVDLGLFLTRAARSL